jgi:replicative DNA helicase
MIDPASTCIMVRNLFDDEYPGGKNELKVYRLEGKNGKTKLPVTLNKDKNYQILFIVKNREGSANQYQLVIEHDLSRNILKEVGITVVPVDF